MSQSSGGSKAGTVLIRRKAAQAVELLRVSEFIRRNLKPICKRLEKSEASLDERGGQDNAEGPLSLTQRNRALLEGIVYLGSTPENYRSAKEWAVAQVPKLDPNQALATLTLVYVADLCGETASKTKSKRKKRLWRGIDSRVEGLLQHLGAE